VKLLLDLIGERESGKSEKSLDFYFRRNDDNNYINDFLKLPEIIELLIYPLIPCFLNKKNINELKMMAS